MIVVVAPAERVRGRVASVLRRDGHEVIALADASHLLARVLGHPAETPLILADPRHGVSDVLEMLRATAWHGPVVLLDRDLRGPRFVEQLRARVRRALGTGTAG